MKNDMNEYNNNNMNNTGTTNGMIICGSYCYHTSSSVRPNLNTNVLMKMKRFCRKKAMPCHQHGKQVGEVEGVVMIVPVGVVPLVPSVPFRGLLPPLPPCGFSVTAGTRNIWTNIHRDPMSPPKAHTNPINSHTLATFLPKHPSVYVSPVICPIETALIMSSAIVETIPQM